MDMTVFRVHKNENYTVLSNYHFKERGMSLKAKGLLSLMLSLPENWDYSAAGLVTLSKDGKDSVSAALKELEKFGYLRRTQAYDEGGKFRGYNYEIFEKPTEVSLSERETPPTQKPSTEKPFTEKPSTGNPPQLNNKELNTKKLKTKKLNTDEEVEERKKSASSYDAVVNDLISNEEVKKMLFEFIKMRKLIKKPLTDFALTEIIKKLESISSDPQVQVEVLKNSIVNNYSDIYAPKAEEKPKAPQGNVTPFISPELKEIKTDEYSRLSRWKNGVMLSEDQMKDLLDKMGLEAFDYYFDKLGKYIVENGDVKSHYQTMLKWYAQDSAVAR
jgi:hypothetical protein